MTLIRSGWEPDCESDKGSHEFTYSIYPHIGKWNEHGTVKEGYFLNNSLSVSSPEPIGDGILPECASLVEITGENVVISAFKRSETEDAYILRIYESGGLSTTVNMKFGFDVEDIEETDLNENNVVGRIIGNSREFSFIIEKFELKTFKLKIR